MGCGARRSVVRVARGVCGERGARDVGGSDASQTSPAPVARTTAPITPMSEPTMGVPAMSESNSLFGAVLR